MKLRFTREMISAALNGELNKVEFVTENAFGFMIPSTCPNVPAEILNPRNTWTDKASYDEKAQFLANAFVKNFKKFESESTAEIMAGAPAHAVAV
jgi:phosphoenolpyruvate carboxykinase (ATP)